MTIIDWTTTHKEIFDRAKATQRAEATARGDRFGECSKCGALVIRPCKDTCPVCQHGLTIVEPPTRPAA